MVTRWSLDVAGNKEVHDMWQEVLQSLWELPGESGQEPGRVVGALLRQTFAQGLVG